MMFVKRNFWLHYCKLSNQYKLYAFEVYVVLQSL